MMYVHSYTILMCDLVRKAYVDIVDTWGWKHYTIIYESNDGLLRLQELLKAHRRAEYPTTIRQLPDTNDYRYYIHSN